MSGNAKVAKAGRLLVVVLGPKAEYEAVLSRIWKIAHDTMLGMISQSPCEITLLAR